MQDTLFIAFGIVGYLAFVALLTRLDEQTLDRRR